MAESRREEQRGRTEAQRPSERDRQTSPTVGDVERGREALKPQPEGLVEVGRERVRQAADISVAAASTAIRSGSVIADGAHEIAAAWARYAEEVMRHTSEASQAMLRARTLTEMLEVQAKLLRDNMQAFLDQSSKIAQTGSKMAAPSFAPPR